MMPHKKSRLKKYYSQYEAEQGRGLFLVDGLGCIVDINSAFTDLLGYRHKDILGRHFVLLR
jgi:PAS domain S-box-containing protein